MNTISLLLETEMTHIRTHTYTYKNTLTGSAQDQAAKRMVLSGGANRQELQRTQGAGKKQPMSVYVTSRLRSTYLCVCHIKVTEILSKHSKTYWRMQNNCTTSDRLERFVFQRCRLLLVVNVKKKYAQCKYATLYGYGTVAR